MAIEEGQFLEFEKRFAAFKHVFNTLQTSVHKTLLDEKFETSHQIYLTDLLTGTVRFSNEGQVGNDANIQPTSHCGWLASSAGSNAFENALLGTKYTIDASDPVYPVFDTNPNVEKVIVPLYKARDSNRQAYFTYQPTETAIDDGLINTFADFNASPELDITGDVAAYQYGLDQGEIINNSIRRLRNWIAPSKFGKDYTVQIFQSNDTFTGPDTNKKLSDTEANQRPSADFDNNNIIHGGYIFDYYQGMMYLAPNPNVNDPSGNEFPYIAGLRHPLWLVGYRYNGPTGSNMTVTSAGTAGPAGTSGGGGGVSTTLISQQPGHPFAYNVNTTGWYDSNTLTATDSEDIIEYLTPDNNMVISASFGEQDLIVRLDSSSYNNITSTDAQFYSNANADVFNRGNIFAFANETIPDYSSYANFRTTGSAGYDPSWFTQSFQFTTPIRLDQVALCYSNDDAIGVDLAVGAEAPLTYAFPAAYKLEGSSDNIIFTEIATTTAIRTNTMNGTILGTVDITSNNIFGASTNNEYFPDKEGTVTTGNKKIYCATASIDVTDRYQYYRLYVSGGLAVGTVDEPESVLTLHHFDLWQNLDFGPTNRKQLSFKFNDEGSGQSVLGNELTIAERFVSSSMAKIGFSHFTPAGIVAFTDGEITGDISFPNTSNILGAGQITASIISASTSLTTGQLTAVSMSGVGDGITFNTLTNTGTITTQNLVIENDFQVNSDVIIPSDKFIFLTNKKQDGSPGTDAFSARIFGNFVEGGGVSDMYLDAYRIYTVADAKMHMRTLHPTLGSIVLESPTTHISGSSLRIDGAITASAGMQLSGSLLISGSIIPNVGPDTNVSTFSLGSSTAAWNELHLSDGTIRLYDGTQEKATIGLNADNELEFKSGSEFQKIKAKSVEFIPAGSTVSSVQISDDGQGFVAVNTNGKNSTIFRSEATLPAGERMGSITQKGTGSFAILLDADANVDPHPNAKFVVESNSPLVGILGQRLFSVSESFETRIHNGGLRADKYVTTTDITASIISASSTITANSFIGKFTGTISSSAQIATEITGAFFVASESLQNRLSNIEPAITGKLLLSGSTQIASNISGAFDIPSSSISTRMTVLETFRSTNTSDIESGVLELQTPFSSSVVSRVKLLEGNAIFTANAISGAFNQTSGSMQSRLTVLSSNLQSTINVTSSYAVINNNVLFTNITASSNISASNIIVNTISSSQFHTEIFNPANINTSVLTASLSSIENLTVAQTFATDNFNTTFAANSRPALTIKNRGGTNITYFGNPVNNADAFVKFESNRSNSEYSVGIDSDDGDFKITSGSYLDANSSGNVGIPPFRIQDNKIGIVKGDTVSYTLDVGGDIRAENSIIANSFTSSGNVSASGIIANTITTNTANFTGNVGVSGTFTLPGISNLSASVAAAVAGGDNLGNHTATTDLNLNSNNIKGVTSLTASANISASGTIIANAFVGNGSQLTGITTSLPANLISASAQIATAISGAFVSPFTGAMISGSFNLISSSLANRITTAETHNHSIFVQNSATSSFLTESPFTGAVISGSFNEVSNSLESRLTTVEGATVTLPTNLVSSSAQITGSINTSGTIIGSNISGTNTGDQNISNLALTSSISGAFAEVSNSLQGRIGTLELHDHSTFAVKTAISGAFNGQTSSFALAVNVVANSATSSFLTESPFTGAMISGSFNGVTGSFLTSVPIDTSGLKSLKINANLQTGSLTVGPAARQIELRGGSTLTSTNPRILSSTGIIEVDDAIQMNSHPIYFHEGATNSYIGVDVFTPDNLRIHANQDLYLVPDDNLIISSSTSAKTIHYNEFEVIGNVTASSYAGSLTNMTGTIDGGSF